MSEERLTKKEEELICYILKYAIDIVSKIGLCGIGSDLLISLCKNELKIFKKLKINLSYCQQFPDSIRKHSEIRIGNDIIEGIANGNISNSRFEQKHIQ